MCLIQTIARVIRKRPPVIPGQIIRVHPSVRPMTPAEMQIERMGSRWVAHPDFRPLPKYREDFLFRQRSRARTADLARRDGLK